MIYTILFRSFLLGVVVLAFLRAYAEKDRLIVAFMCLLVIACALILFMSIEAGA